MPWENLHDATFCGVQSLKAIDNERLQDDDMLHGKRIKRYANEVQLKLVSDSTLLQAMLRHLLKQFSQWEDRH